MTGGDGADPPIGCPHGRAGAMTTDGEDPGIDHGPALREVDQPAPEEGRLERAIGVQVRRIRQASGATLAEMAVRTGISKPMLSKIENAQTSCSLSILSRLAAALEVPATALFRGADVEREAVYTPAGHGPRIVRRGSNVGHVYHMLGALRGEHKRIEPLLCTLTDASEVFPLFQHVGTEFLYMLEGVMVYVHGEARYTMSPGDSLTFDGECAHGPGDLVQLPITFLTVTGYGYLGNEPGTQIGPHRGPS